MRAIMSITPSEPTPAACPRAAQSEPSRALVLVGSAPGAAVAAAGARPSAVFLAQLIASAQRAPQTRRRRRAEPNEVSITYAAVSAPAAPMGRAMSRSM